MVMLCSITCERNNFILLLLLLRLVLRLSHHLLLQSLDLILVLLPLLLEGLRRLFLLLAPHLLHLLHLLLHLDLEVDPLPLEQLAVCEVPVCLALLAIPARRQVLVLALALPTLLLPLLPGVLWVVEPEYRGINRE